MKDDEIWGPVGGDPHVCKTEDGVDIHLGLRVIDYDARPGVVVEAPSSYDLADPVCWPQSGHNGHWWGVCRDEEGHQHVVIGDRPCRSKIFDGSRMTTRGVE